MKMSQTFQLPLFRTWLGWPIFFCWL